jgi:hypothetical protein
MAKCLHLLLRSFDHFSYLSRSAAVVVVFKDENKQTCSEGSLKVKS